jgi:predicted nucleic acid-binding protein
MNVVCNTTVLSNFAALGGLDLLHQLYGVLHIPTEVYAEVRSGLDEGYSFYTALEQGIYPWNESGWVHLTGLVGTEEQSVFGALPRRLHEGERACLAIAQVRGWLLLTDDRAARNEARRRLVSYAGSTGCLVLAVERGLCCLEEANTLLAQMAQQGYYAPLTDLTPLLRS